MPPTSLSRGCRSMRLCAGLMIFATLFVPPALAAGASVRTNEAYIDDVLRQPDFDIHSIDEVFDHVFSTLADEVKVYPTENYFYFKFLHGGVPYAGNFRLDIADRDQGVIHFAYFTENNPFTEQQISDHRAYTTEFGVSVERKDALTYAITRQGRTVTFRLNDLRHVKPTAGQIGTGETYLGPVFDESGVQMFLMWNPALKLFLYVLDESLPTEEYFQSSASSRIRIGLRTSFAYYRDRYRERWILAGVRAAETEVNSYFDGPFDQLPDNFIEGDTLRDALLAMSPDVEGKIDRLGNSEDLTGRMLVDPYILYETEDDLQQFDQCAAAALDERAYYPCFATGQTK
ncbi:MAG: hypothetical protein Q8Q62_02265 [Mesorhizobium sp.]|nr:hypothetical protein [Mesorhizobium sp.]